MDRVKSDHILSPKGLVWFMDGSKSLERTKAEIYSSGPKIKISLRLMKGAILYSYSIEIWIATVTIHSTPIHNTIVATTATSVPNANLTNLHYKWVNEYHDSQKIVSCWSREFFFRDFFFKVRHFVIFR